MQNPPGLYISKMRTIVNTSGQTIYAGQHIGFTVPYGGKTFCFVNTEHDQECFWAREREKDRSFLEWVRWLDRKDKRHRKLTFKQACRWTIKRKKRR